MAVLTRGVRVWVPVAVRVRMGVTVIVVVVVVAALCGLTTLALRVSLTHEARRARRGGAA